MFSPLPFTILDTHVWYPCFHSASCCGWIAFLTNCNPVIHSFSFFRALTQHMTPPFVTSVLPPVENVGTTGVEQTATLQTQHMYSSEFEYLLAEEEAHVSILLSVAARSAPHLLGSGSVKPSRTSGINMQFVPSILWGWLLSTFNTVSVSDDICGSNIVGVAVVSSTILYLDSLRFENCTLKDGTKITWSLKMALIGLNYHHTLCNTPEEHRSHQLHDGTLKSYIVSDMYLNPFASNCYN